MKTEAGSLHVYKPALKGNVLILHDARLSAHLHMRRAACRGSGGRANSVLGLTSFQILQGSFEAYTQKSLGYDWMNVEPCRPASNLSAHLQATLRLTPDKPTQLFEEQTAISLYEKAFQCPDFAMRPFSLRDLCARAARPS